MYCVGFTSSRVRWKLADGLWCCFLSTSSPSTQHAYALELLHDQLYDGAKALDVGSGSGILSACFARMVSHSWRVNTYHFSLVEFWLSLSKCEVYCCCVVVVVVVWAEPRYSLSVLQVGPKGKVIGIDHIQELVDDSINNVNKDDPSLLTSGRVTLMGKMSSIKGHRDLVCSFGTYFNNTLIWADIESSSVRSVLSSVSTQQTVAQ